MSKTFLGVVGRAPVPVNVMSNLVNENIVEVKIANRITVVVAEFEGMSAEEYTLARVDAVAAKRTGPRPLLLSGPGQKKYSTKTGKVLRRHSEQAVLNLSAPDRMDEIGRQRCQGNNAGKSRLRRKPTVEAFVCGASLSIERIIKRPIGELGFAVGIASWP